MKGRVLWITERYPPARGGMAVSCARQTAELRRRGFGLDVLYMETAAGQAIVSEARDNGFDWRVPGGAEAGVAEQMAYVEAAARHGRERYSVVVGFGASYAGYLAVTYGAWLGVPAVTLVRGNDLDRDWFAMQRGHWVREALGRAAGIGAVSMEKVLKVRALFPSHHVVWTPNSVDMGRWELLPGDEEKRQQVRGLLGDGRVVGLFGELKAKKRVGWWLEAVRDAGLLERVNLLVVGSLDVPTAAVLDDPAVGPRSMRMPFCRPEELAGLYAACDFVAVPSMYEGMPNVLLEAMACGVVPIVSGAGAMAEVVRDGVNGFVFAAEDRAAAGETVQRALALTDGELDAMKARARETVREEFSAEREMAALIGLLEACGG